jgi:uncharacterized protein (UPF0335 family)
LNFSEEQTVIMAEKRKNTPDGGIIYSYVERLERLHAEKKTLSNDITAVKAEAKANGYSVKALSYLVKIRTRKPQELAEEETLNDLYRHAIGMDVDLPLFRGLETAIKDPASQKSVLEGLKALAPTAGEIIFKSGNKQMRIWRDKDGIPHAEDYSPPPAASSAPATPSAEFSSIHPKKEVPDSTEAEAEELGFAAAKGNRPVIDNPFPYGDKRRPRWDAGWRRGAGNNGFGGK